MKRNAIVRIVLYSLLIAILLTLLLFGLGVRNLFERRRTETPAETMVPVAIDDWQESSNKLSFGLRLWTPLYVLAPANLVMFPISGLCVPVQDDYIYYL